jgi:hypothetical protein
MLRRSGDQHRFHADAAELVLHGFVDPGQRIGVHRQLAVATRHRTSSAPRRVWLKGAPKAVLRLCAVQGATLHAARDAAEAMAARALCALAFATVDDDALDTAVGFDALRFRPRQYSHGHGRF